MPQTCDESPEKASKHSKYGNCRWFAITETCIFAHLLEASGWRLETAGWRLEVQNLEFRLRCLGFTVYRLPGLLFDPRMELYSTNYFDMMRAYVSRMNQMLRST